MCVWRGRGIENLQLGMNKRHIYSTKEETRGRKKRGNWRRSEQSGEENIKRRVSMRRQSDSQEYAHSSLSTLPTEFLLVFFSYYIFYWFDLLLLRLPFSPIQLGRRRRCPVYMLLLCSLTHPWPYSPRRRGEIVIDVWLEILFLSVYFFFASSLLLGSLGWIFGNPKKKTTTPKVASKLRKMCRVATTTTATPFLRLHLSPGVHTFGVD